MKSWCKSYLLVSLLTFNCGLINLSSAQTLTTLHSFLGGNEGGNPYGSLILSSNTLYGTTSGNWDYTYGNAFAVSTNGSVWTNLHSFSGGSDGANPFAGLTLSGDTVFGTTQYGGINSNGCVFKINLDGSGFTTLYSFTSTSGSPYYTNSDGARPVDRLVLSGNVLYGTTPIGGSYGEGTLFAVNLDGTGFTTLHNFGVTSIPWYLKGTNWSNLDGANPNDVILCGHTLYGTTSFGGSGGNGTVFAIGTDGTGFTNLHNFSATTTNYFGGPFTNYDGAGPSAGLMFSGNALYGTAGGGGFGYGTVFTVNTNGTGFTTLHSFTGGSDGASPSGSLILSGSTLYGTTGAIDGGTGGGGTVFSINTSGTGFATVYSFSSSTNFIWVPIPNTTNAWFGSVTNSDGFAPKSLMLWGDTLYGVAAQGGIYGNGTVFSILLRPQLTITSSAQNIILTWPTNATGFILQASTNLVSPVWTTNLPTSVVANGQYIITNPISGTQRFFRVSQ